MKFLKWKQDGPFDNFEIFYLLILKYEIMARFRYEI